MTAPADLSAVLPEAGVQTETDYRFARRFGVLPGQLRDRQLDVYVRADCDPQALLELRRLAGHPLRPIVLDDDAFAARLRDRYERSANDAMQSVEGLGEAADRMSGAQYLAEPEDQPDLRHA